jgi:hypothetical protein
MSIKMTPITLEVITGIILFGFTIITAAIRSRPPAISAACTAGRPYGATTRKVRSRAVDGPSIRGYLCPQRHWIVVKTPEDSNMSWRNRTSSAGPI